MVYLNIQTMNNMMYSTQNDDKIITTMLPFLQNWKIHDQLPFS